MNGLTGRRMFAIAPCVNVRLNWRKSSVSTSFLAPGGDISMSANEPERFGTFWDGEEANHHKGVLVGSSHMILDVADREVERIVFVLTGCNRNRRLV